MLLADLRGDLPEKDVLERLHGRLALVLEPAGVPDRQLLSLRELISREAVLDDPVMCLQIPWIILQASAVVEFRFVNFISFQMSKREIAIQIRLELNDLFYLTVEACYLLHRLLAAIVLLNLGLGLQFLVDLLGNEHCLLPTVDCFQILLLFEERVAAVFPVMEFVHGLIIICQNKMKMIEFG